MNTILIFFIATVMATSVAEARGGVGIITVNGTLYCTSTGNRGGNVNAPPVFSGANMQVVCPAGVIQDYPTVPTNATTDSSGLYRVLALPHDNATLDDILSGCRIFVLTPLSTCNPMLPSAGLVSALRLVQRVPIFTLYNNYFVASGFTPQP